MSKVQEAAADYMRRGWQPIRVEAYGKRPIAKGWQNTEPAPHQFQPGDNIGINFGRSGDLLDVDLDWPAAREIAAHPLLFGDFPAFGREGQTPGHRLVRCPDAPKTVTKFELARAAEKKALETMGISKAMVLELRASGQTVVPPSCYATESGAEQRIVWACGGIPTDVPSIAWRDLQRRAALAALLALVLVAY